ncbi:MULTISPECIES: fumarylacetoacetate hydrolase family protein [unclassified Paraburkholderia]|uniref:fumarylacetoacetate hydrolase family protein n=1 Tax=Paraburkholderia TaxID=1822464 RepID=UPI00280A93E1|nr:MULTISPECIES: fumarylacetoacetate hydrolase family protein [unclassified Paraburkholderia]
MCARAERTAWQRTVAESRFRKAPDSYTVLGPWLVIADEIPERSAFGLEIRVNGELRQSANTRDVILHVPALIAFASSFYTLNPGDVIITGTPEGVGPVVPGDIMLACIDVIGSMQVTLRASARSVCA